MGIIVFLYACLVGFLASSASILIFDVGFTMGILIYLVGSLAPLACRLVFRSVPTDYSGDSVPLLLKTNTPAKKGTLILGAGYRR